MRTANVMGLAVLFLGVMTVSAMGACSKSAPRKVKVAPTQVSHRNVRRHAPQRQCHRPQRSCHGRHSGWELGLSFNVPSSSHYGQPRTYAPPPQQSSSLSVNGTLYDVDGGDGTVVSDVNSSSSGGQNPAVPQPLAKGGELYNPQWVELWRMGWAE